jgi:hypothetical protein
MTPLYARQRQDAELKRLSKVKRTDRKPAESLGGEMVSFFKHVVARRQTKLGKIAECWSLVVPIVLQEHCALESLNRGTLTIIVDTSSHLYDLKQLLLAGLEKQLLVACKSTGLRKITLKLGRWYDGEGGERKIRFD